ncbi:MAG: MATE family efflux transporter [candidate division WS1 bacterium]|nr:MATE family efflux transporter [candidate division WS1 bacterium]
MEDDAQEREFETDDELGVIPAEGEPEPSPAFRRVDLTHGHLLGQIVRLSWPIVAGSFLQWMMGVVDIKMVGTLGPASIAAVGTSRDAIFTFLTLVFAVATGAQIMTARYMGQHSPKKAADACRQAIILSVLLGLIIMPAGYFLSGDLLAALGAKTETLALGTAYMKTFFIGTIPLLLGFMLTASLQGAGDTLTPLYVNIGVVLMNIVLNWMFIFGVGPLPAMGVIGAAWGTVIARTVAGLLMFWIVTSGKFALHVPLLERWPINLPLWGKMAYIGVPSSIESFARNLGFLSLFWILNQTDAGRLAVAGYAVSVQIRMFGVMFGLALMSAAMTAVSQNMGAQSPERAERSGWTLAAIAAATMGAMGLVQILLAGPIIGFFTSDPETIRWGVISLVILSLSLPFTGLSMGSSGSLRGAGDTLSPLYATLIFTMAVGPVAAYVGTIVMDLGPLGAWAGIGIGTVLQSLMVAWIFKRGKWKQIKL